MSQVNKSQVKKNVITSVSNIDCLQDKSSSVSAQPMNALIIRSLSSLIDRHDSKKDKRKSISDTSRRSQNKNHIPRRQQFWCLGWRRMPNVVASAICQGDCDKSNMADFTKTILTVLMQLSPPFGAR